MANNDIKLKWTDGPKGLVIATGGDGWKAGVGHAGDGRYSVVITRNGESLFSDYVHGLGAAKNLVANTIGLLSALTPGHTRTPDTEPEPETRPLVTEQAPPVANAHPAVWPLVLDDMESRDREGRRKYGVPLQPHNGRDTLIDLYQELLDAVVYTRTLIYERDGK
jgi:hypothetical protein